MSIEKTIIKSITKNSARPATVAASYYNGAIEFARRVSRQDSLDESWIEAFVLETEQKRVDAIQYERLLNAASKQLSEPCFGLKYGCQIDLSAFNLLGYLAMSSPTLAEASKTVNQYGVLVSEVGQLQVDYFDDGLVRIMWQLRPEFENCSPQVIDGVMAGWINFGKKFLGGQVKLNRVHLTEREAEADQYELYYDCPVLVNQPDNAIFLDKNYFDLPLQGAEPLVHSAIQLKADQTVKEINSLKLELTEKINRELPYLIFNNRATLEETAKRLNLTARSLQRKLKQQDINFRELLDKAKYTLATKLLVEREMTISSIATLVGFNDQSSFNRAFKRWTGKTPKQFQSSQSE